MPKCRSSRLSRPFSIEPAEPRILLAISLAVGDTSGLESQGLLSFPIMRLGPINGSVIGLTAMTQSGTALAGADFTAVNAPVNVAHGAGGSVPVTVANDPLYETDETFSLRLSGNPELIGAPRLEVQRLVAVEVPGDPHPHYRQQRRGPRAIRRVERSCGSRVRHRRGRRLDARDGGLGGLHRSGEARDPQQPGHPHGVLQTAQTVQPKRVLDSAARRSESPGSRARPATGRESHHRETAILGQPDRPLRPRRRAT